MIRKSLNLIWILLLSTIILAACSDDETQECPESLSENVFQWGGVTLDASANNTNDFVICSNGEIDVFINANTGSELTFGFDRIGSDVSITLNSSDEPEFPVILSQARGQNPTSFYIATSGVISPCGENAFQFDLDMKSMLDPTDFSSHTGQSLKLSGLIKCN